MTAPPRPRINAAELKTTAAGRWSEILERVAGIDRGLLDGRHHACPRCGGTDRFRMVDEQAGAVFCNRCFSERNGDGIAAVQWMTGCDFPTAMESVADFLGLQPAKNGKPAKKVRTKKAADPAANLDFLPWDQAAVARWCLKKKPIKPEAIQAIGGRLAKYRKQYVVIALPIHGERREQADPVGWVLFNITGGKLPCWTAGGDEPTWEKMKTTSGSAPGYLGRIVDGQIKVKCEGPPDVLALLSCDDLPSNVSVLTNAHGAKENPVRLAWLHKLFDDSTAYVIPDADKPGIEGATEIKSGGRSRPGWAPAIARHAAETRIVKLPYEISDTAGKDLRDWLQEGGCWAKLLELPADDVQVAPEAIEILVAPGFETTAIDNAIQAIASSGQVYQRAGTLVQLVRDAISPRGFEKENASLRIAAIDQARLREIIAANATVVRICGDEKAPAHPPEWLVKGVVGRGQWLPIPGITAVSDTPILRPDGTVASKPGLDLATGVFITYAAETVKVPDSPSHDEAKAAADLLFYMAEDFPFADREKHKSAWLAAVLTIIGRETIGGPCPMFLFDANCPGAGKGLLAKIAALVGTGRDIPHSTAPRTDEEFRKRVTAIAQSAERAALIDNISGKFGFPSLDAVLTTTVWQDRLLGENTLGTYSMQCVWLATGNNLLLAGDLSRRIVHVRLDAMTEKPEEREDFRIKNLLGFAKKHRAELAGAALTVLRGFFAAGKPDQHLQPWGSFEDWSAIIRNTIVWLGFADPAETRKELATANDSEVDQLRTLLSAWFAAQDQDGMTTKEALERATGSQFFPANESLADAILALSCSRDGKFPTPKSLGCKLNFWKKRVVDGKFFSSDVNRKKITVWRVVEIETAESTSGNVSCSDHGTY